jgi:hypothetical protein
VLFQLVLEQIDEAQKRERRRVHEAVVLAHVLLRRFHNRRVNLRLTRVKEVTHISAAAFQQPTVYASHHSKRTMW